MTIPEGFAPDGGTPDRPLHNPIDVPRLLADLAITEVDLQGIAALHIPDDIGVSSTSGIKTTTVEDGLHIAQPARDFGVEGDKVASGVNEQPLGQDAIDGALNRLGNLVAKREADDPGSSATRADFSVENGLFRVSTQPGNTEPTNRDAEGVVQFTEGADLTREFDSDAEYEDRAVVAIRIPGQPVVVQVSPASEAVRFPREAVHAAAQAEGGLVENTAGSKLAEMGLVADKQNPHSELTADRPGGPLPRQDQMARVMLRGLLHLARQDYTQS